MLDTPVPTGLSATDRLSIHVLSQLMGHASTKVSEIYLRMVGEEQRRLVMEAREHQTGSSPPSTYLNVQQPIKQHAAGQRPA